MKFIILTLMLLLAFSCGKSKVSTSVKSKTAQTKEYVYFVGDDSSGDGHVYKADLNGNQNILVSMGAVNLTYIEALNDKTLVGAAGGTHYYLNNANVLTEIPKPENGSGSSKILGVYNDLVYFVHEHTDGGSEIYKIVVSTNTVSLVSDLNTVDEGGGEPLSTFISKIHETDDKIYIRGLTDSGNGYQLLVLDKAAGTLTEQLINSSADSFYNSAYTGKIFIAYNGEKLALFGDSDNDGSYQVVIITLSNGSIDEIVLNGSGDISPYRGAFLGDILMVNADMGNGIDVAYIDLNTNTVIPGTPDFQNSPGDNALVDSVARVGDKVYLMGTRNFNSSDTNTLYVYDLVAQSYTTLKPGDAPESQTRNITTMVAKNNKVYLHARDGDTGSSPSYLYIYNPSDDTLTKGLDGDDGVSSVQIFKDNYVLAISDNTASSDQNVLKMHTFSDDSSKVIGRSNPGADSNVRAAYKP